MTCLTILLSISTTYTKQQNIIAVAAASLVEQIIAKTHTQLNITMLVGGYGRCR